MNVHRLHTVCLQLHYPVHWLCCLHMLSFSQCDIFSQLVHNWLYNNVYSMSLAYTYSTIYNYTTQYIVCAVYIWSPFHNVIFFHNYCTIDSTTMSTAYPQNIHTVLFTITLPSILTLLFIYASFTQCDIFSQLLHNWLYNNVYSISSKYTYGIVYNYTTQYTDFSVYICFPFHNVNIFPQYYIIVYSTMFTVRLHWTLTVLFTITLPSILIVLCIYILSFHNDNVLTITITLHCNNVYSERSPFTYSLFTITLSSILTLLFTYAFLFTMWYFFTITAQLILQQCLQHILSIYIQYCLQLHNPVYCMCFLHMLPFHNVILFHNHCPIHSTTMCTAYPQHIHTILFTITLPSIITVLFTFTFPFTMWIFFHSTI